MRMRCKIAAAALAACLSLVLSGPGTAKETWKLGTAAQPGSVLYDIVMEFVNDFNKAMDGKIVLEFQFVGNEQELFQQVVRGRLQMGGSSFAGGAIMVPEGAVMNAPYIWKDDAERAFVTDNYAVPVLKKMYAEKGLELFSVADVGWNDMACTFACLTPESIKGVKVRVSPSPASRVFFAQLGANGVQMPLSEAWPALQSGLVRAADLPFLYYVTTPAAQSAPHYVVTRHYHHPSVWIMNKPLFDRMDPELRAKMLAVVPDPNKSRQRVADTEKPKMEEFVAKGGFVHELTPEQREAWAKVVRPGQIEMVSAIGGQAQLVYDSIMEGKKAWAEKQGKQ